MVEDVDIHIRLGFGQYRFKHRVLLLECSIIQAVHSRKSLGFLNGWHLGKLGTVISPMMYATISYRIELISVNIYPHKVTHHHPGEVRQQVRRRLVLEVFGGIASQCIPAVLYNNRPTGGVILPDHQ